MKVSNKTFCLIHQRWLLGIAARWVENQPEYCRYVLDSEFMLRGALSFVATVQYVWINCFMFATSLSVY